MDLVFSWYRPSKCLLNYLVLRCCEYFIAKIKECVNFVN